jgi:putative endonuclease
MVSGDLAESLALDYLVLKKFKLEARNFNCRYGEIDLIMWDGDSLVFVEVRYRQSNNFGGALESIDYFKQQKLRRTAEFYLVSTKRNDCPCRFDILCVNGNINHPDFEWIANAF